MASFAQTSLRPFTAGRVGSTLAAVSGLVATKAAPNDEAGLAQRAAGGDGDAFATLYERYEQRVYNLCLRITGAEDDAADATQEAFLGVLRRLPKLEGRELAFGSYVFTSARNACYDQIERRRRAEPSDQIPEQATPVGGGVGGGGIGFNPGDPEDDPERNVLQEARTEEIRTANAMLPERQREALALKELEELSYDEIAEIMDMNRNSVAQLISRARINLRDALRGTALASIAASSPDCERALPLIAARQDRQLDPYSDEGEWLGDHLLSCDTCRLGLEAMEEAGLSYRAWVPIAAGPVLFRETMARAADLVGADWSALIHRHEARRAATRATGAAGGVASGPGVEAARAALLPHPRIDLTLSSLLAVTLLLVALVSGLGDGASLRDVVPAAEDTPAGGPAEPEPAGEPAASEPPAKEKKETPKEQGESGAPSPPFAPDAAPAPVPLGTQTGTPATPPTPPRPQRRTSIKRRGQDTPAGGLVPNTPPPVVAEPPPDPPAPPDPPVVRDPPPPPAQCRDAQGNPIPCPPPRRPPPRTPPTRPPPPPR